MKHIWTILCRRSIIDSDTNNLSLNESVEHLGVEVKVKKEDINKPINIPFEHEIVSFWTRDAIEKEEIYSIKIELVGIDGVATGVFSQDMVFPSKMRRMRSRVKSATIALKEPGIYNYRIFQKLKSSKEFILSSEVPIEVDIKKSVISEIAGIS